jgi:hypothetical protein
MTDDSSDPPKDRRSWARLASDLLLAVSGGRVTPRDASIWAAVAGIKALLMNKREIAVQHGIGVRQVGNIVRAVDSVLKQGTRKGIADGANSSRVENSAFPLVAAEIDLLDHPHASDGRRAVETLRSIRKSRPVRRLGYVGPSLPAERARQHRMRRSISGRVELLADNPELSVAQPYLVVPWALPDSLAELVPPSQRGRGRPPDEEWLAYLVDDLRQSYECKDGRAHDLGRLALWGFSRFPHSPFPDIEAEALRDVALLARERGSMVCYWLFRRVGFLVGDLHPSSLLLTADAAITLRDHGYAPAADRLLRSTLAALNETEVPPETSLYTQYRILDQLTFNYSRSPRIPPQLDVAAQFADQLSACVESLGLPIFKGTLLRRRFGVEFAHVILRCVHNRERFWLHGSAWDSFTAANNFSSSNEEEPIYRAQWTLERMSMATMLRDRDHVVEAAHRFLEILEHHPWIKRDHPDESHGYRIYRNRAAKVFPGIDHAVEPLD